MSRPKGTKKCIACHGKGYVPRPEASKITKDQKRKVLSLYRKGTAYREICRQTGIDHPQKVKHIIEHSNNYEL